MVLTDVYEVAILKAMGHRIEGIQSEAGKVKFVFEDTPAVKDVMRQFYQDELVVSAKKYKHAIQDVRSLVFNEKGVGKK